MNIAEYSIRKKTVTLTFTVVVIIAGLISYLKLPRLEDPEFTIKQAMVITAYPGASARQVEKEVTEKLEEAIQGMGQLKRVESRSMRGRSIVIIYIKDSFNKFTLPQVWDELRRKISDAQSKLPPGAYNSVVYDDYGDVYGMYFAITGDGHSMADLKQVAKFVQRELLQVKDVRRITLWGVHDEAVYIEVSREKMAALGISPSQISSLLTAKNIVSDAGSVKVGREYIAIVPSGEITSFEELGNILISKDGDRLIYLKDIADVKRSYVSPPTNNMRYNGKTAIGLAASTVIGGNAQSMGDDMMQKIADLKKQLPLGIEISPVFLQSEMVRTAMTQFVRNVIEAVLIITLLLLVTMGYRSGFLIGAVLIITVAMTMIVMKFYDITLQRISLGALVIALGMLVDDAIVVTEGMMTKIHAGMDKIQAATEVISQNMWPLLAATLVSALAFGSIGLSNNAAGEMCGSLFYVILIALLASWITALTVTPIFCYYSFKSKVKSGANGTTDVAHDPYGSKAFRYYRKSLELCLRFRWTTVVLMLMLLALSIYGFRYIPDSFFTDSSTPKVMVDVWMPEGTHIDDMTSAVAGLEAYIAKLPHVTNTTTFIGGGAVRFTLTYNVENNDSSYAQILVAVDSRKNIPELITRMRQEIPAFALDYKTIISKFRFGPGMGGRIQARFSGRDIAALRKLGDEAMRVMAEHPNSYGIRSDWREKVKTICPQLAETQSRQLGISHHDLCSAILEGYGGKTIGIFREEDDLLPIISRAPENWRSDVKHLENILVWSSTAGKMIPYGQVVNETLIAWENPIIMRRNRVPAVTIHCDASRGEASKLLAGLRPKIEAIPMPPGCKLEWGGDYEESNEAQAALIGTTPIFLVIMILMVVMLFNSLRHTLIIWLTVPLTIIGVVCGLLLFKQPFSFMALLGFLSLSGMQIRNAVVLLNEINCERERGKAGYEAVLDSAVSRIRPVTMAAFATVLGMVPLLTDAFFTDMAITIMFGLTFASILTLYVIPVLYSILFRIPRNQPLCQHHDNESQNHA
jgi:multidrug efflux pump subunit AcrB